MKLFQLLIVMTICLVLDSESCYVSTETALQLWQKATRLQPAYDHNAEYKELIDLSLKDSFKQVCDVLHHV